MPNDVRTVSTTAQIPCTYMAVRRSACSTFLKRTKETVTEKLNQGEAVKRGKFLVSGSGTMLKPNNTFNTVG